MFAGAARLGRVDILMNNAGVDASGTYVIDLDMADFDRSLRVNLYGPVMCTTLPPPAPHPRGGRSGRIINVTSVHEENPGRGGGLRHRQGRRPQPHPHPRPRAGGGRHHRQQHRPAWC